MLREIFIHSCGDLEKEISLVDLRKSLNLPSLKDAEIIARQLSAKNLVELLDVDPSGDGMVYMTMRGIEESERLEKPGYERFPNDHPIVWPIIVSMFVSIFVMLVGMLVQAYFRQ